MYSSDVFIMHESEQGKGYQKLLMRILLLLLLPLIVGGLYLISTRIALRRPATSPVAPETPAQEFQVD